MNINQTKLQAATNTINQIEALASQLTYDELHTAKSVGLWDILSVFKTTGRPFEQTTLINLRNKLIVLNNTHGFNKAEVDYVARQTFDYAITCQPEEFQFELLMLDPMFNTGKVH